MKKKDLIHEIKSNFKLQVGEYRRKIEFGTFEAIDYINDHYGMSYQIRMLMK